MPAAPSIPTVWLWAGVGGHNPSARVDVGQPGLKNIVIQCPLALPHFSFLSCQEDGDLKKEIETLFFAV